MSAQADTGTLPSAPPPARPPNLHGMDQAVPALMVSQHESSRSLKSEGLRS